MWFVEFWMWMTFQNTWKYFEYKNKIKKTILIEQLQCDPQIDDNACIRTFGPGHLEVVKYLYEVCKCDPQARNNECIRYASWGGHLEVVKYLYEVCKCDPTAKDSIDRNALGMAIKYKHEDVVNYLIPIFESKNPVE